MVINSKGSLTSSNSSSSSSINNHTNNNNVKFRLQQTKFNTNVNNNNNNNIMINKFSNDLSDSDKENNTHTNKSSLSSINTNSYINRIKKQLLNQNDIEDMNNNHDNQDAEIDNHNHNRLLIKRPNYLQKPNKPSISMTNNTNNYNRFAIKKPPNQKFLPENNVTNGISIFEKNVSKDLWSKNAKDKDDLNIPKSVREAKMCFENLNNNSSLNKSTPSNRSSTPSTYLDSISTAATKLKSRNKSESSRFTDELTRNDGCFVDDSNLSITTEKTPIKYQKDRLNNNKNNKNSRHYIKAGSVSEIINLFSSSNLSTMSSSTPTSSSNYSQETNSNLIAKKGSSPNQISSNKNLNKVLNTNKIENNNLTCTQVFILIFLFLTLEI